MNKVTPKKSNLRILIKIGKEFSLFQFETHMGRFHMGYALPPQITWDYGIFP